MVFVFLYFSLFFVFMAKFFRFFAKKYIFIKNNKKGGDFSALKHNYYLNYSRFSGFPVFGSGILLAPG